MRPGSSFSSSLLMSPECRVRARFEREESPSRNCKAFVRPDASADVNVFTCRKYRRASSAAVCFSLDVVRVVMEGCTTSVASRLRCGAGGTNAGFEVPLPAVIVLERSRIACEKSCSSRQRCSARVVGVVVAARCDMMVAVLLALVVRMWAHCSECQGDPSCRDLF
jgi:hypothetical protein